MYTSDARITPLIPDGTRAPLFCSSVSIALRLSGNGSENAEIYEPAVEGEEGTGGDTDEEIEEEK
eukprot:CAMPEP_0196591938 /NCGR_PEP_ID=MMETSP1081-20130531/71362_1 /TAXON_ID=36882 /ORGANISM="Pyramimonas amylifera, Strain CCMP720" /LENGTH=64 /DNA_ID=CAMNT_0041915479 /DNA_START=120 /DNA_END=314 /DNA_ORIENTATION=+